MMNRVPLLPLLTGMLLFCTNLLPVAAYAKTDLPPQPTVCNFLETTGKEQHKFTWILSKEESWVLSSQSAEETYRTWLDQDLGTRQWSLNRPEEKTSVVVRREGDFLLIEGRLKGKTIDERIEIDSQPWYQALSLSLRKHLDGSDLPRTFWMLRPDNLDPIKMQSTAVTSEELQLGSNIVETFRIEVRPVGWRSAFWKGHYWFRRSNGRFVRYEGDSGPPGCPPTVVIPSEANAPPP